MAKFKALIGTCALGGYGVILPLWCIRLFKPLSSRVQFSTKAHLRPCERLKTRNKEILRKGLKYPGVCGSTAPLDAHHQKLDLGASLDELILFGKFDPCLKILLLWSPDPLYGPRRGRAVTRPMKLTWLDLTYRVNYDWNAACISKVFLYLNSTQFISQTCFKLIELRCKWEKLKLKWMHPSEHKTYFTILIDCEDLFITSLIPIINHWFVAADAGLDQIHKI